MVNSGGIADAALSLAGANSPANPMAQNAQMPDQMQAQAVIAAARDAWEKLHDSPERNPQQEAAIQTFVQMFGQDALRWLDQQVRANPSRDMKLRALQDAFQSGGMSVARPALTK